MTQVHFDKLLLTVLVLLFAALAFRGYHVGNGDLSVFAADSCKLFIGALLAMLTNRPGTAGRNGDTKPNGNGSLTNGK